jgi:surfactin synthase thioesterase subunit
VRAFGSKGEESSSANGNPSDAENSDEEQDTLAAFHWIISAYSPPRCDTPVTMFLTEEQEAFTPFLERRWRNVAARLEVHRMPGQHLGAITTDVGVLTSQLHQCLDRVNNKS